jgi:nucleoid DNA-binding protein
MTEKKDKSITKDDFFDDVSALANYCDRELVEAVYYGMIKVISRQLRAGKKVKMPDWGEFYLHNTAARMALDVSSGKLKSLGMKKCVKFDPDYKVKAYFKEL